MLRPNVNPDRTYQLAPIRQMKEHELLHQYQCGLICKSCYRKLKDELRRSWNTSSTRIPQR